MTGPAEISYNGYIHEDKAYQSAWTNAAISYGRVYVGATGGDSVQYERMYLGVNPQVHRYRKIYLGGPGSFFKSYASDLANYASGENHNFSNQYVGAVTSYEGSSGLTGASTRDYIDAQDDDNLDLSYTKAYAGAGTTTSYSKT